MVNISVIIPVFNVEKYIKDCLNSVLNQTISDYEILCVNDGSEDCSREIIEEYAKKNKNIKIIDHVKNYGLSVARNTGIKNAKGKYIIFLDSDDMIVPEALENLLECADKNDLDVIYFNMRYIYESGLKQTKDIVTDSFEYQETVQDGKELFRYGCDERHD